MGKAVWRSIETLTRPDGSLAESLIFMRDGTRIRSTLRGALGAHEVLLPDGRRVRVERQNGIQALYVGDSRRPLLQSVWTSDGPQIAAPRQRVADLLGLPRRYVPSGQFDEIVLFDPSRLSSPDPELALGAAAGLTLPALYGMMQAEPAAVGAGSGDVAAVAFRVWKGDAKDPTVISLAALTAEAVAQNCKRMPEVQAWTNEAARSVGPLSRSPQARGTAIHKAVETRIKALKDLLPPAYADIFAELSFDPDVGEVGRGTIGSTRLDVLENAGNAVCVYDIKTLGASLTPKRVLQIGKSVAKHFGLATFFIIEIRPFE